MNTDNDNLSDSKGGASASQAVRAQLGLRELILGGELAPGARISEVWVAEHLGVSRTPIRAALIRLQEEGLVEPIPSGGFAVRSFAESEISDSIELRGTMEGLAVRLAAERGVSQSLLNVLRDVLAQIDTALVGELTAVKFSQYVDLNARFHQLLIASCGSALIARQTEKVANLPFASASAFVMVQSIDESAREMLLLAQAQHRAVVEAIEQREGTRAEALMREHSRIANRNLKFALQNQQAMSQVLGGSLIRRVGRMA